MPPLINGNPRPTFNDIREHLGGTDPRLGGKHLRMDEDRGLHLHDTGKPSGVGPQAVRTREAKHQQAFEQVAQAIDRQLRHTEGGRIVQIGRGVDVLRDVLGERDFQNQLISINDLDRIAARMQEVEHTHRDTQVRQFIDQIADSVAHELEPGLAQDLRQKLHQAPFPEGIKLGVLQRFAQGKGEPHAIAPDALRSDLDRMGPWQALARHGLIHGTVHDTHSGTVYQQLTVPDSEGFASHALQDALRTRSGQSLPHREIIGQHGRVEATGGFFHYHTHDQERCIETGDKVHISIAPDQVDMAWDVIAPILMEHPDVIKQFKLCDMEDARQEIARLDTGIAALEAEQSSLEPASDRHQQISQELARLRTDRERPLRVHQGAQITIYSHQPRDGGHIPAERFRQVMEQVTQALHARNFEPGHRPDSDLPVNDFITYRRDKTEDGQELRPDHPQYREYLSQMKNQPLYITLAHPQTAGVARELRQLGERIHAGEEVRGRRNGDGSVTLYDSSRKPSLFSQLTGQTERRRERAQHAVGQMLTQFEATLGTSPYPTTRHALQDLRARLHTGPLLGAQLAWATTVLEQSLHQDASRALEHGWHAAARREAEATQRTHERITEVRETDHGHTASRLALLGQDIRGFDRNTLRPMVTGEQGLAFDRENEHSRFMTEVMEQRYSSTRALPRQQVMDDLGEPGFEILDPELAGTVDFMEISQQLHQALNAHDIDRCHELAARMANLLAPDLQALDRTAQLSLTLGTGQAFIDGLARAIDAAWPPHPFGEVLREFAELVHGQAVTQLADRLNDDASVVLNGKTYAPQSVLSSNNFGTVELYQAEDGSHIVLKTPRRNELHTLEQQLDEARNEVRAHRAAQGQDDGDGDGGEGASPWVIGLRGAMRGPDGLVRIALEYAPGGNLGGLMQRIDQARQRGDISPQAATLARITLLRDTLQGMRHVQESRGMLHLDLKPINFFIGEDGRAKVGDFGTAQVGDSLHLERRLVDNPRWQAPEIILGTKRPEGVTVDGSADIWALGITAYQLFHERALPFDHPRFDSPIDRQLSDFGANHANRLRTPDLRPLEGQPENLGVTALDRLLNQLLHPNPELRPSLGQALQERLFQEPGVGDDEVRALIQALSTDRIEDARAASRNIGV